jgi:hypothetical protein
MLRRPVGLANLHGMSITPDTKNWTWVLERACPECGFDTRSVAREDIGARLRDNAMSWIVVLSAPDVSARPEAGKWSPLEYACHVRDCNRVYDHRLDLMLSEDDPQFPNWDQDESAVKGRYAEQNPEFIAAGLVESASALADRFETVTGDQWLRTGHRGDGSDFTVETLGRYFLHDPLHHLWDVTGLRQDRQG